MKTIRVPLIRHLDPASCFRNLLERHENAFWLDGGPSGISYIGTGERLVGEEALKAIDMGADITQAGQGGFQLGFVGWIPYEFAESALEETGDRALSEIQAPRFLCVEQAVAIDNETGRADLLVQAEAWGRTSKAKRDEAIRLLALAPLLLEQQHDDLTMSVPAAIWRDDADSYTSKILACQSEIAAGNGYVICLTTEVSAEGDWDVLATYQALRRSSPTHHGGVIRIGDTTLVSASPERFLEVSVGGTVRTHPIKGTRPRGTTQARDEELAMQLRSDEKEQAENIMIVDLMRNDLQRVCAPGSVRVERLLQVESYAQVHQLVSTVAGKLSPGTTFSDLIKATFPAGSMTGAPKRSVMNILARLEARTRGVYAGAFGFVGVDGTVDLAMSIRSIVIRGTSAVIGTGGGITALSKPRDEFDEAQLKARALIRALRLKGTTFLS